MGQESSEVSQHLESLTLTQEALEEEIAKSNKLLTSDHAKIASFVTLIGQKQTTIATYKKKIYQIVARTGVRDSGEAVVPVCLLFVCNINSFTIVYKNHMLPLLFVCLHPQHEDLSPLQIKVQALMAQIEELAANIKSDQQLWMKRQGTLVGLTQEIEANSKDMLKLQTEYTVMQQKKIRLEST